MKKTMKLASRGKRFAAGMIDLSVPLVAYFIMTAVFGISILNSGDPYGYGSGFGYGYGYGYNYNYSMPMSSGAAAGVSVLGIIMLAYIIAELVLYARAQSIGKAVLGLQVVSSNDGKAFGFWKMMLRECIVKSASGSTFLLGYLWILIDEKNRSWHDKILDSYVVDLRETANMHQREEARGTIAPETAAKPEAAEVPAKPEAVEAPAGPEAIEASEEPAVLDAPVETTETATEETVTDDSAKESANIEELSVAGDAHFDDSTEKDDSEE